MSVPNQKIVQIAARTKRDSEHLYATINIDALQLAIQELKGSALKLWLYFNKNQDKYKFELSQKACLEWGIKKDSYYDGLRELIAKGYLMPIYEGSNIYYFYEKPKAEKPKTFSETENPSSVFPREESLFPERNNTNNTTIKQNRTMALSHNAFADGESGGSGKAATAPIKAEKPFKKMSEIEKQKYLRELGF